MLLTDSNKQVPDVVKDEWVQMSTSYTEALGYMRARQNGTEKSLVTKLDHLNDAGFGGLSWNETLIIGGRPGSGKTLLGNYITRGLFDLNPTEEFDVLDFQLEMTARTIAVREFSGALDRDMKYLYSTKESLPEAVLQRAKAYAISRKDLPIFTVEKIPTVKQFLEIVDRFISKRKRKVIITLDHSFLLRQDATEKDKFVMLHNLGAAVTYIKRSYTASCIVLSQLNRETESFDRLKEGTNGNYLQTTDLYGGDALLQHADMLMLVDKPANHNLTLYGGAQYIVTPHLLALHFLKCRNGDSRLRFVEEDFAHQKIKFHGLDWAPDKYKTRLTTKKQP